MCNYRDDPQLGIRIFDATDQRPNSVQVVVFPDVKERWSGARITLCARDGESDADLWSRVISTVEALRRGRHARVQVCVFFSTEVLDTQEAARRDARYCLKHVLYHEVNIYRTDVVVQRRAHA